MDFNTNTTPNEGANVSEQQTNSVQPQTISAIPSSAPRKRTYLPLLIAAGILVAGAAAATTYVVMKQTVASKQPTAQSTQQTQSLPAATTPQQPVKSQSDQVRDAITYVQQQLSGIGAMSGASLSSTFAPHRLMGDPYNIYAAATDSTNWRTGSKTTADFAQATTVTKAIYDHFVTALKAKVDVIDGDPNVKTLGTSSTESSRNFYRLSTDAFTCGLVEQVVDRMQTQPYTATSAQITFACSTTDEYTKNAELQKPLYTAYSASKDYSKDIMLGLPTIKASAANGYQTAQAQFGNDGQLVGGSVGLFYQTPDKAWHYFINTQNILPCSTYNTTDLKNAYAGEQCGNANGSIGTVKN